MKRLACLVLGLASTWGWAQSRDALLDFSLVAPPTGDALATDDVACRIHRLPACHRAPLLLRLVHDLSGAEIAERAEAQQGEDAKNANAWYWQAYALGRYGQGISVAKALALRAGGQRPGPSRWKVVSPFELVKNGPNFELRAEVEPA